MSTRQGASTRTISLLVLGIVISLTISNMPLLAQGGVGSCGFLLDPEPYAVSSSAFSPHFLFRHPSFSGSTNGHINTSVDNDSMIVAVAGSTGLKSLRLRWTFKDTHPERWVRLTTFDAANRKNPIIPIDRPFRVRLRLDSGRLRMTLGVRETNPTGAYGTDGGATGDIEWIGATYRNGGAPQGVFVEGKPGVWQTFVFDPTEDAVMAFSGNGILESTTGKAVFENLSFSIVDTAGPFVLYLDDLESLCGSHSDMDLDGLANELDLCPRNSNKFAADQCGCNVPFSYAFTDTDLDGVMDCADPCPLVANASPSTIYYRDADGDGFGSPTDTISDTCLAPTGYVLNATDCDDSKGSVHPGAIEICGNDIDDNCNGDVDESCIPVHVTGWKTVRTHRGVDRELLLEPSGPVVTEPRQGGIQLIRVEFDRAVAAADGLLDSNDILVSDTHTATYTPRSLELAEGGTALLVRFDAGALPNGRRYTLNVSGKLVDAETGAPLEGDADCEIRTLVGDVNGSGMVDSADAVELQAKENMGKLLTANPGLVRYDLNLDGATSILDASVVKLNLNRTAD